MRSMIYLKKTGGIVKVHNKDTVEEIVDDGIREKTQLDLFVNQDDDAVGDCAFKLTMIRGYSFRLIVNTRQKHTRKHGPRALSAPASTVSLGSGSQRTNHSLKTQDWLNESTIIELQKRAGNECQATKQLYANFMETERTFVKSVEDYLAHKEFTDLRKRELLHKKWTEEVYEPIRKKILDTIDKSDWNQNDYHKREKHRIFLENLNKRGVVFLDNDDKEESSLEAVNSWVKAKTKPLLDPLHTESRQRSEEEKTILLCMTGHHYSDSDLKRIRLPPLSADSRSMRMPRYSIENLSKNKYRHSMYGNNAKTSFDFRCWAAEGYDAKMAAQELQIPHKRMFAEHPPFGKPPVVIPRAPFIDPDDFADKIVNTNPFNLHMANLRAEAEAVKEFLQIQQQFEEEQKVLFNEENQQKTENHEQLLENSHSQQLMESDNLQQVENDQ